jgi:hypothetical protein
MVAWVRLNVVRPLAVPSLDSQEVETHAVLLPGMERRMWGTSHEWWALALVWNLITYP